VELGILPQGAFADAGVGREPGVDAGAAVGPVTVMQEVFVDIAAGLMIGQQPPLLDLGTALEEDVADAAEKLGVGFQGDLGEDTEDAEDAKDAKDARDAKDVEDPLVLERLKTEPCTICFSISAPVRTPNG
jgi:hypothetical protein